MPKIWGEGVNVKCIDPINQKYELYAYYGGKVKRTRRTAQPGYNVAEFWSIARQLQDDIKKNYYDDSDLEGFATLDISKISRNYIRYMETRKTKDIKNITRRINTLLDYVKTHPSLTHFARSDVYDLQDWLRNRNPEKPLKNATVNRHLTILNRMFNVAVNDGIIPRNPILGFKNLPEERVPPAPLTVEDIQKLLSVASELQKILSVTSPNLKDLINVYIHTGCRRNEIFQLKWQNVYLNEPQPFFNIWTKDVNNPDGRLEKVTITSTILPIFHKQMKNNIHKSVYVFPSPINPKNPIDNIRRSLATAAKKAGLNRPLTIKHFRQTHATLAAEYLPEARMAQIMRHRSPDTTRKYYVNLKDGLKNTDSELISSVLVNSNQKNP